MRGECSEPIDATMLALFSAPRELNCAGAAPPRMRRGIYIRAEVLLAFSAHQLVTFHTYFVDVYKAINEYIIERSVAIIFYARERVTILCNSNNRLSFLLTEAV